MEILIAIIGVIIIIFFYFIFPILVVVLIYKIIKLIIRLIKRTVKKNIKTPIIEKEEITLTESDIEELTKQEIKKAIYKKIEYDDYCIATNESSKFYSYTYPTEKEYIFSKEIYPLKKCYIEKQVDAYFAEREIKKDEWQKEIIRQEILSEEKKRKEAQRKKELRELLKTEMSEQGIIPKQYKKREPIPQDIQNRVWNRDGGKCVLCGSQDKLEFDHVIPFSKGGANTYRNLQLLCETCNRRKSDNIG